MANTSIRKTFSSNGNTKKWTLSWWEKKNKLSTVQRIFSCDEAGNNNHDDFFQWQTDDKLVIGFYDSGYYMNLTPDRKFKDTNAWYHFVFTWDTAQATSSNRAKFYVNGVQETSFSTETYPSQNKDSFINTTEPIEIGKRSDNDTQYLESTLSHVHFCDGYAYSASDFGSTDSTTGEWKINTSPSVSYGTNGFWILKDGNTITDSSPNSNDWSSVSGTLTKTEDCPSNVFATMNPLDALYPTTGTSASFSNGNNTITTGSGSNSSTGYGIYNANIGVNKGKFYWEVKPTSTSAGCHIGIISQHQLYNQNLSEVTNSNAYAYSIRHNDGSYINNDASNSYAASFAANDIIGVALDLSSNKIYFSKNGVWANGSGGWGSSTFDASVGAITITDPDSTQAGVYFPCIGDTDYAGTSAFQTNFGNGYFGTTQISSEGTNASGIGKFEYDVPTGYTALSTKGLNE